MVLKRTRRFKYEIYNALSNNCIIFILYKINETLVWSLGFSVFGSSGHEPGSKNLQNKQGTDGGVPAGSPMLKLVSEIESVPKVSLPGIYFHVPFSLALPPLFIKKDDDPLSLESG